MHRASRTKIRYRLLHPGKRIYIKYVPYTIHPKSNINTPLSAPSPESLPDVKTEVNAPELLDSLVKNTTSPLQTDQWLEYGGEIAQPVEDNKYNPPAPPQPASPPEGMLPLPPEEIDPTDDCISYAEWQHLSTAPLYEGTTMTALEGILLTHQFLIHANMNKSTSEELLKLLSILLPTSNLLPPSYYKLMKVHKHLHHHLTKIQQIFHANNSATYHYYCHKCWCVFEPSYKGDTCPKDHCKAKRPTGITQQPYFLQMNVAQEIESRILGMLQLLLLTT
jgi:hypothetical protein